MHQYQSLSQSTRTTDVKELRAAILGKLTYAAGKDVSSASDLDWFVATALAARDQIIDGWLDSTRRAEAGQGKRVYYLSIEYLIGRVLFDALTNLGLMEPAREALASFGVDLDRLRTLEPDAGLGNGGLGRLAACFMDSMASLALPAYGYGIRYQQGLFKQEIRDGWQHELPDDCCVRQPLGVCPAGGELSGRVRRNGRVCRWQRRYRPGHLVPGRDRACHGL